MKRHSTSTVIDIHAHLSIPAADALLQPHLPSPAMAFSSAQTDAVNRELFARIGCKLVAVDERIADMHAAGEMATATEMSAAEAAMPAACEHG